MIRVAAAVIERDGKVLIAKRSMDDPLKHKWEFPGGKIEGGETPEECLQRELNEELGIEAEIGEFVCSSRHHYAHMSVELIAFRVTEFTGIVRPRDHEEIRWVEPAEFSLYDFPEADLPILEKLRTPSL
ncbi:MAG: (deoxy)nucleoside triphosphate pyrophosphohydrolase [Thermodesulfovibrionales bacterium]